MIGHGRAALLAPIGATGDESESLQADVMRFVAILGLCLMVIFALVQSLPAVPESREAARERAAERAELVARLGELEGALAEALERAGAAEAALADAADPADVEALAAALTDARETLAEREGQREATEALAARLDAVEAARTRSEAALARAEAESDELRAALEAATAPVEPPPAELEPAPAVEPTPTVDPIEPAELVPPADAAPAEPTPVEEPPAPPVEEPAEEGFRLRFASEEALYALVASGTIGVYARVGDEGFRLAGNGRAMVIAALPPRFNEMAPSTIPAALPGLLERAGAGPGAATWGVTLSAATERAIVARTEGATGGTLVIGADGRVELR